MVSIKVLFDWPRGRIFNTSFMGTTPTTTNEALGTAEKLKNEGVMDGLEPVITQIISTIPQLAFLKLPFISFIYNYTMVYIFQAFSKALQVVGVKLIITIQTDEEQSTYSNAEGALRAALVTGDPDAIAKANAEFNAAIDSLIHYDGSSPIIG